MAFKTLKLSVLSHFYIAAVLNGLQRVSGLFVLELLKTTNVTRQNAATPFIFSWAIGNLVAAVSDIVVEQEYSEFVILLGVLLTAAGSALSIFETSVTATIAFWGIIFGSGYGLALPHLSRSLKSTESGKFSFILGTTPCLGILIMSFVLPELTLEYGLQGSYLILSGIILHYLPLALAAAYNISICIPNVKWRVRKKSNQYIVSKENEKIASAESFINSLEPDIILEINSNEESEYALDNKLREVSTNIEYYSGRKRSDTKGAYLHSLETFPSSRIYSQELCNEKGSKLHGEHFCIKENSLYCTEQPENKEELTCNTPYYIKSMGENELCTKKNEFYNNFKKEVLTEFDYGKQNEVIVENEGLEHSKLEKKNVRNYSNRGSALENKTYHFLNTNESSYKLKVLQNHGPNGEHSSSTEFKDDQNFPSLASKKITLNDEVILNLSSPILQCKPLEMPMDIKVHVEECTFTAEEFWKEIYLDGRKLSMPEYDCLSTEMHDSSISKKQSVAKDISTASNPCQAKLTNVSTISKNPELPYQNNSKQNDSRQLKQTYIKRIAANLKFLQDIASPICLCIMLMAIIFEINLVTLLTMFADISNDSHSSHFKWILAAFGVGGIAGRFCSFRISKVVPEKSHTVGVVLFLLTGLSTAGILYSPNSYWLAGFYSILGGLEGGFTFTIPKIILEYTDKDLYSSFSSVKNFLLGVTLFGFLYAIGLFPNELEDNEFLLQTLSCSSVLCAFFAYFLPYLRFSPDEKIVSLKDKLECV